MRRLLMLALALCLLAVPAAARTVFDYGWEDGGTILGQYGNIEAYNVCFTTDPVHAGCYSLKLVDQDAGTPQAYVAAVWNLVDGDVVTAGFWRYDTTPAAYPSARIWGHWNDSLPGDINGYNGSASGNYDYGPGEGWDYVEFSWTVSSGHTGLIVEARTYGDPGAEVWIDDLHIDIPDHAYVQVPGECPVSAEEQTWGGVKAMFR
ncbi:MAG: hypothetical protein R6X25_13905 [Candidatus Krumholzibacteriia bacterium]